MIDEQKLKDLSPNIRNVVESALKNQKLAVYQATEPFTGTNSDTIEKIKEEIRAFKEYQEAHKDLQVSINSFAKQKQIYKITMVGRLNSLFQDKKINAYIFFPDTYPNKPPVVYFQDINVNGKFERYLHVNVFLSTGNLCQEIVKTKFKETIHVKDFLLAIEDTLYNPNPLSPANAALADLYQKADQRQYNDKIKAQSEHLQWADVEE